MKAKRSSYSFSAAEEALFSHTLQQRPKWRKISQNSASHLCERRRESFPDSDYQPMQLQPAAPPDLTITHNLSGLQSPTSTSPLSQKNPQNPKQSKTFPHHLTPRARTILHSFISLTIPRLPTPPRLPPRHGTILLLTLEHP